MEKWELMPQTGSSNADSAKGAASPPTGSSLERWRPDALDWIIWGSTRNNGDELQDGLSGGMWPDAPSRANQVGRDTTPVTGTSGEKLRPDPMHP